MKHSLFSASAASRWSNCPGSMALSQGIPKYSSAAAIEGTAGHTLGERCLIDDSDPLDFIGTVIEVETTGVEVTVDLAEAVQKYVDYVRGITGTRWLETKIFYHELLGVPEEDGFGTGDCCILDDTTLHVIDAKFGRGYVDPYKNKQMILYAAGVVHAMEAVGERIERILLHVVQPRVTEKPVPYEMDRADLAHEVNLLRTAAQTALEASFTFNGLDDPEWVKRYLNPGEYQCQWCPGAAVCPALRAEVSEFTAAGDDEFTIGNVLDEMSAKTLGKYQSQVPLVEMWIKAVEHETLKRLTRGDKVPGYKLVKGREGNRKWADPAAAAEAFNDVDESITHNPAELKTPPQLEKALGKNKEAKARIAGLIVRNPARPTMTTEDDPREPWTEAASADEFGVVSS